MKSRGILMTTVMVEALLKGTKTETRRGRGLKEINESPNDWNLGNLFFDNDCFFAVFNNKTTGQIKKIKCPYGSIGDSLWVRETYLFAETKDNYPSGICLYKADFTELGLKNHIGKWKHSLFMKKENSRFDLKITSLWCERLQDITEESAIAEGVESSCEKNRFNPNGELRYKNYLGEGQLNMHIDPTWSYSSLIEFIHGKGYWEKNPWVWVIKFEDITKENW